MKYIRPKKLFLYGLGLFSVLLLKAQTPITDQINIWNGDAPGSESVTITEAITDRDPNGGDCYLNRSVSKVTDPSIKPFLPENPNGTAVLLCPGGGYALLAYDKEGYVIADWFNQRDITAFVLKYRLPIDGHTNSQDVPMQDVQRALRYIRANADQYNIDPNQIGVMGGSAGGHLAASASVFYDKEVYTPTDDIDTVSAKPNFTILMYPVVSFQDDLTHTGSRSNLLGSSITQEMKDAYSPELHVDANTGPAFLFHSLKDGSVKYQNSEVYAQALTDAGVSSSLNLYESGGHGVGFCEAGNSDFARWPLDLNDWLVDMQYTTPCQGATPSVTVSGEDSTILTASTADSYQWYNGGVAIEGATESTYTAEKSGYYSVAIQGQREGSLTSCLVFSEEVIVDICQGFKPEITVNMDGDLESSRTGNIQWFYEGDPIQGATDKVFSPGESGSYQVATINSKPISGEECLIFSDAIIVDVIPLQSELKRVPKIYPNPVNSVLTIENLPDNSLLNYKIYDVSGAIAVQNSTLVRDRLSKIEVDGLDSGLYYIVITTGNNLIKGRFIKQ